MTAEEWMQRFAALADEARADGCEITHNTCCCGGGLAIEKDGQAVTADLEA